MRIEFELVPSLPRLAWCACLQRNHEVLRLRHGPWVEARPDCFFEGAWDGPLEQYGFSEAVTFVGSGGHLCDEGIRFSAPTHPLDRLYSLRVDDALFVSNSLVFALVQAGQALEPGYRSYYFDFLDHYRAGLRRGEARIPLRGQRHVRVHHLGNILVTRDLSVTRTEKTTDAPPAAYAEYAAFLEETVEHVLANAQHPARVRAYRPVTTISLGYDSTAVSVLASRAGCREAVTFRRSGSSHGYADDCGTTNARHLGLQTTEYERLDFDKLPGLPEAEFFLNPLARTDSAMVVMADQLAGSTLMTGRGGGEVWRPLMDGALPLLQQPACVVLMSGASLAEFRLRTGFIHFPVPFSGAIHGPAIRRITLSDEMKPWWVEGGYNRPIPRRMAEEAGIPRGAFAREKRGGPPTTGDFELSLRGKRDFLEFYESNVTRGADRGVLPHAYWQLRKRSIHSLIHRRPDFYRHVCRVFGHRAHPMWGSRYLYAFQWGVERLDERYRGGRTPGGGTESSAAL